MTNTDHLLRNRFVSVAYLPAKRPVIFVHSLMSDECAEVLCGSDGPGVWGQLREKFRDGMTFHLVIRFIGEHKLRIVRYSLAA